MCNRPALPVLSAAALALAVLASTPAAADDRDHHQARGMPCADLVQLSLPDTVIRSAVEVPAGPFPFGNAAPTCSSDVASPQLPAFCRVVGVVAPLS